MTSTPTRIPYARDLTPKNRLTKEVLDHMAHFERLALEASRGNKQSSPATVQMSIRMKEAEYLRFRALCRALRKTNGSMVVHLLEAFLEEGRGDQSRVGR